MKIDIDSDKCVGCGLCEETIPELFEMGQFVARTRQETVPDALIDAAITMVEDCPAEAMSARK